VNGTPAIISLQSIGRSFDADMRVGLKQVTLTIERGEFVAIVGPSGAGKSTLLNVLGLLDRPTVGVYEFNGIDVGGLSEGERNRLRLNEIGFVFQSSFVLGDQSTLNNAALGLRIQGVPMMRRSALAWRALKTLGIASRWSTSARLLSGGERQRLAIARAIATRPSLILADEPTGNLDTTNGQIVIKHLRQLNRQGTTVIVITHDPGIAAAADRQLHLVDGRLTTPAELVSGLPSAVEVDAFAARSIWNRAALRPGWRDTVADDVADAISSLSYRLLRTSLLVFAFTLGISGLIVSSGLSESASAQVSERLTKAALDEVRITPPGGASLLDPGSTQLTDWMSELSAIPHVQRVGWVATVPASIANLRRLDSAEVGPTTELILATASPSYLRMMGVTEPSRESLGLLDDPTISGAAWAGPGAIDGLNLAAPGPGSTLWAVGRRVDVIGAFATGSRAPQLDRMVVVTHDVIAGSSQVGITIVVRTEPGFPAVVADAAPLALDAANPGAFRVETVAELRALRFGVANDLGAFVGILSLILLALATISASTTMYLSVQSRAHEIALRRAIGSSRFGVARLFVAEGFIIGTVGGSLGAVVGTVAALLAAQAQGWTPVLPPALAPLAIMLGILTGLFSAAAPAWSASRQEPAAAIRA
jgi:macrolide transport system ATP-binding/permease protein